MLAKLLAVSCHDYKVTAVLTFLTFAIAQSEISKFDSVRMKLKFCGQLAPKGKAIIKMLTFACLGNVTQLEMILFAMTSGVGIFCGAKLPTGLLTNFTNTNVNTAKDHS